MLDSEDFVKSIFVLLAVSLSVHDLKTYGHIDKSDQQFYEQALYIPKNSDFSLADPELVETFASKVAKFIKKWIMQQAKIKVIQ